MPLKINEDVLSSMYQYLRSDLEGVAVSYQECENKELFVSRCKQIILEGWVDAKKEPSDFFPIVLRGILVEPSQNYFKSNRKVNKNDDPITIYFGRFCLLRNFFDLYKDGEVKFDEGENENLKNWFIDAKNTLNADFDKKCGCKFIYGGKEFKSVIEFDQYESKLSAEELISINDEQFFKPYVNEVYNEFFSKKSLLILSGWLLLISIAKLFSLAQESKDYRIENRNVFAGIMILMGISLLALMYSARKHIANVKNIQSGFIVHHQFLNEQRKRQNTTDEFKENKNVKKLIFLTEEEINASF